MKKLLVVLVLLLCLGGWWMLGSSSKQDAADPAKIEFKSTPVKQGLIDVRISATGVVEPNFQVEVKSKASGRVLHFPFEAGDRVKKGKLLLTLDKSDETRNVARAQADLQSAQAQLHKSEASLLLQKTKYETDLRSAISEVEAAEANLKDAQDKLARQEDLFKQKVTARETLDSARTTYLVSIEDLEQAKARKIAAEDAVHDISLKENEVELAKAEVTRSQIALDEALEKLQETEIFAPITGVITEKLVEEGQIISSGISNVSGGTALLKIADLSRLFITADVDETDIGMIRKNQDVTITTDAFPNETFTGKVQRIAPQGVVENSITLFKVKIEIQGSGRNLLKPMMSANVDIVTQQVLETLYVPREAIWKEDETYYAGILDPSTGPKKVSVIPGIKNLVHVQILSGLEKSHEVILEDWEDVQKKLSSQQGKMSTVDRMLMVIRFR